MQNWKRRARAGSIHLGISLIVALAAAMLVFGVWYPYPYSEMSGGRSLFMLLVAVDVVVGPLLTIVVFNSAKSRRELMKDLSIVGVLQLAALCYGLWTVYSARPVYLVFEYHRLAVVHASDIEPGTLEQAIPNLRKLPNGEPSLLSLRPFRTPNEEYHSAMAAVAGLAQAAQPALWQSWDAARADIIRESRPLNALRVRYPNYATQIDGILAKTGLFEKQLTTLPVVDRDKAWTALIDTETTMPIAFLPLDSF